MISINYPKYNFRVKEEAGKEFIFDEIRKQWVRLTPEEWVRQNFLQYLIQQKHYPSSLIAVEKEIKIADIKKRCDIIIFKQAVPYIIVECKEMDVPLSEKTIQQILTYNQSLAVEILIITNGNITFAFETKTQKSLEDIPSYH
ncbi:MAG: type I restriction enzyme HsdR N-terminal domain-containing protein [Chitinophagaceae bacterium]|nr:type I restriction enzyme HsdR N-terminal domain-containing protein [Chitinophagaceae bacterium]MCW5904710.1 type I restriction enzyme HsdR N-terminal domain-containing protein [Chitinophagaceae bacterium]